MELILVIFRVRYCLNQVCKKCMIPVKFIPKFSFMASCSDEFTTLLQEEGWSMGVIEGTSIKGIFPDNFTKPLS